MGKHTDEPNEDTQILEEEARQEAKKREESTAEQAEGHV
jgi:hypothetical protein